jgi:phospholipid-translocating ATPase
MQRFLGAALFFKSFVPDYSRISAPLNEMTHKDFDWNEAKWKKDYKRSFEELKVALMQSTANHFPDYDLPWVLRVDASDVAVGAVLFQERTSVAGVTVHEPIGFASSKFTATAFKWDAFKKEAYAAYFGVHYFAYYLRGKPFILETDHRNLLWIEKSEVPIVVRWRVYLQSFVMYVRHIPGTQNRVADWLSRMERYFQSEIACNHMSELHADISVLLHMNIYPDNEERVIEDPDLGRWQDSGVKDVTYDPEQETAVREEQQPVEVNLPEPQEQVIPQEEMVQQEGQQHLQPEDLLRKVHGGRSLHFGARRTWILLNKQFPGHRIPYRFVQEFISSCAICQKDRLGMTDFLQPVIRDIKQPHQQSRVGVD